MQSFAELVSGLAFCPTYEALQMHGVDLRALIRSKGIYESGNEVVFTLLEVISSRLHHRIRLSSSKQPEIKRIFYI